MDWILHVDTDELMYPAGSPGFSLQEVLGAVPSHVDSLVFPNHEALPEREDVLNPFLEVTLFKKNFQHIVSGEAVGAEALASCNLPLCIAVSW